MSTEQRHLDSRPVLAGGAGDDLELDREEWTAVRPREISAEQWSRFEGYMLEIFTAMGLPGGTVSTAGTPRRFLEAVFDATSGYEGEEKLVTAFLSRTGSRCTWRRCACACRCMQMRGVCEIESSTRTTYWRGSYGDDPDLRAGQPRHWHGFLQGSCRLRA